MLSPLQGEQLFCGESHSPVMDLTGMRNKLLLNQKKKKSNVTDFYNVNIYNPQICIYLNL